MMKKKMMTDKMGGMAMMPQGYANGGKAKPFAGKQTAAEEKSEARMVSSGKMSPAQYKAKEMAEEKRNGEKSNPRALMATGKAMASGRMSPDQYAGKAMMADGGSVKAYADMAGNAPCGNRSRQDFGK
jgi:hypothetical protein